MFGLKTVTETMVGYDPTAGGSGSTDPVSQPPIRKPGESLAAYTQRVLAWQGSQTPVAQAQTQISQLLQNYPGAVQIPGTNQWRVGSRVISLRRDPDTGKAIFFEYGAEESARILKDAGISSSGSATGSTAQRLTSDDPRYWANQAAQLQLGYDQLGFDYNKLSVEDRQFVDDLAMKYQNNGLDAESARQQALAGLIANRNNNAVNVAQTSAGVAKQIADYAANPRDAVAELIYRNQVGGTAPFRDTNNSAFGEYGKTLAQKGINMFQPVGADLQTARNYVNSPPPLEFLGTDQRAQLGLAPTPAGALAAGTAQAGSAAPAPAPAYDPMAVLAAARQGAGSDENFLAGLQRLAINAGEVSTPQQSVQPRSYAEGGELNFDDMFNSRPQQGFSPSSSEGGTNLNIHERAVIVGESGQIYATLGEKRPDGSIRAEQLQIKPLKSEVEKDKKLQDADKAKVESQQQFVKSFAEGGGVNVLDSTPEDFMQQLTQLLQGYGGQGGGTSNPLGGSRFLAGAPANAIQDDPVLMDYVNSAYSAKGIDPRSLWADIKKYTPGNAQLVGQTRPRVSYL